MRRPPPPPPPAAAAAGRRRRRRLTLAPRRPHPAGRCLAGLTASSKSYEKLYPSLAGPTLILNLPFILQADTDSSLPHTLTHTRARSTYLAQPCPASREPLHSECRRGAALACRGDADVHLMTCPALFLALPQAFVGLFKPLFPKVVQARLKFERARLPHPHPHPGRVASGGASPARPSVP